MPMAVPIRSVLLTVLLEEWRVLWRDECAQVVDSFGA